MRTIFLIIIFFSFYISLCSGQSLAGQYIFERRGEVFYDYVFFQGDSSFSRTLSGDMGTFYGEGTFEVKGDKLILNFDSTGVYKNMDKGFRDLAVRQGGLYITDTKIVTLTIVNIKSKKFDLECDYTGRMETFKRPNKRQRPNK